MRGGKCPLGLCAVLALAACKGEPCEKAAPSVHLELVLSGVSPDDVRSLEILLDAGEDRYRRVYNLENQLADGRTSLSVAIEPAPSEPFEIAVDVRAFDAVDGSGSLVASRAVTMELEPNGCNDAQIELIGAELPDAGVPLEKDAGPIDATPEDAGALDAEPIDAEPIDAEPIDADAIDAEPIDADAIDADPIDADPIDAEPMDADPIDAGDAGTPDTGCLDDDGDGVCNEIDNCPNTPNPLQEDTDGVAAYPVPFAPVTLTNPIVVQFGDDDDDTSNPIPLGFTFEFFGLPYSQVVVSTNGFLSFALNANSGCCEGQAIPDNSSPNNLVALAWNDLITFGQEVRYQVLNDGMYRRFILEYDEIHLCCSQNTGTVTVQAVLSELNNEITIHTTQQPNVNDFTRGVEGPGGLRAAYLPGESSARFPRTNSSVRFTTGVLPDGIGDACSNAH